MAIFRLMFDQDISFPVVIILMHWFFQINQMHNSSYHTLVSLTVCQSCCKEYTAFVILIPSWRAWCVDLESNCTKQVAKMHGIPAVVWWCKKALDPCYIAVSVLRVHFINMPRGRKRSHRNVPAEMFKSERCRPQSSISGQSVVVV